MRTQKKLKGLLISPKESVGARILLQHPNLLLARPPTADLPLAGLLFPHGRLCFRYESYRDPPRAELSPLAPFRSIRSPSRLSRDLPADAGRTPELLCDPAFCFVRRAACHIRAGCVVPGA